LKPLRLRVENLTAFRGEQEAIELAGLDLFAIAGPTGSGKSSLLDAMVYALYGAVPRVGKNHKELISLGRDRMCVRLDFARGGDVYRITRRSYRGSTPAQAILDRLASAAPDAAAEPLANGVTAVTTPWSASWASTTTRSRRRSSSPRAGSRASCTPSHAAATTC
jgi:hypothetical protein